MRSFLRLAVLSLAVIQAAAIFGIENAPVVSVSSHVSSVFGISRGGGLFGGKSSAKTEEAK